MTNYITRKCPNCGHMVKMPVPKHAESVEARSSKLAIFSNEAPPFLSDEHGTLRLVTPDIFKLGLEPFWKAVAVALPATLIVFSISAADLMLKYVDRTKLDSMIGFFTHAFAPIVAFSITFPVVLKKASKFWTWSQPEQQQDESNDGETEPEPDEDLPYIERDADYCPCWEYTVQVGRERQLRRYYPPQYRDSRGRMHYVDIPDLRRFALEVVHRHFEWVDATRDETVRLNRAQYVAIREDWQGQGWIENMPNKQKRVTQQAPIHMIATREPV